MSTQTAVTDRMSPTVAGHVADARAKLSNDAYVAQSDCVDWLLDCLNVAVRSAVRAVIVERLNDIRHLNIVAGTDMASALDHIQMALQVDAAFDHLELGAA